VSELPIKLKTPGTGAASKAPAPAPVAAPVAVPPLPELADAPEYVRACENRDRLAAEFARLDGMVNDVRARINEARTDRQGAVNRVLAGANAKDVRPTSSEQDEINLSRDRRVVHEALDIAKKEVVAVAGRVKHEVAAPFAPYFRAKVRLAALAFLAHARAMAELDDIRDELGARSLLGYGGCVCDLPRFAGGNPADKDSQSASIIRGLIEAGALDEAKDAALLAGLAIAPPRPVYVEPAPKPEKKKEPTSFAKALRSLGVSFGDSW
jgi:hypothetical protein